MPTVTAYAPLGTGLTTGVIGLLARSDTLIASGILLTLAGLPPLIIRTLRNSHRATAEQLTEADHAGYHRALDHVARGLLDAPTPPTPGHRADRAEQDAGNVITLRPNDVRPAERKAQ
ncbi:hypothetical protein AB0C98_26820 [Streptomyces sp. NPDC048558]|uniref:hypothetical protein n=1 Tax=Streptomyces sp. NPDC048558 TaxID=3155759 RepID=UPI0034265D88